MVAKLVIGLFALLVLLGIVFGLAYRYFDRRGERRHEKDMTELEHTHDMVSDLEDDPIDRELERGRDD